MGKFLKPISIFAVLTLSIVLVSCAHTGLVTGEGRPEVQVDRKEYIHRKSEEEKTLEQVQSETIDKFIEVYNQAQTSEDAQIKGNYQVFRYKDKPNIYYVFSEGMIEHGADTSATNQTGKGAIAIQLNDEGNEVVMASAIQTKDMTLDTQLKVAGAVIDVMKSRGYIPKEQLARIARLQSEVNKVKGFLSEHVAEFNAKIESLDTSLPDINSLPERDPLPEFKPDEFDPFELKISETQNQI